MPRTFTPFPSAVLTTARIAAFIPGASPPLVNTPIVRMILSAMILLLHRRVAFHLFDQQHIYFVIYLTLHATLYMNCLSFSMVFPPLLRKIHQNNS